MPVWKTQAMEKLYGIEKEYSRNNFSSWNVIRLRLPGSPGHRYTYIITMGRMAKESCPLQGLLQGR